MKSSILLAFTLILALALARAEPRAAPVGTLVAGVQYTAGAWDKVDPGCGVDAMTNVCALELLVRRAAQAGAALVVLPEYALGIAPVPAPQIGASPFLDDSGGALQRFSRLAREHAIYLLVNIETLRVTDKERFYNTLVAFGPDGSVVARHDKFELFSGERATHAPGDTATVFDTPFGKVGMLVCADLYGDTRIHARMVETLGARLVAVSSWWTARGAPNWPRHFASNWGVFVISANITVGAGHGGGFFDPRGTVLAQHDTPQPTIVLGTLPPPSPLQ